MNRATFVVHMDKIFNYKRLPVCGIVSCKQKAIYTINIPNKGNSWMRKEFFCKGCIKQQMAYHGLTDVTKASTLK